jgi:hypothetical protein
MSTPLLGFLIFHDNYLFECRVIQHHNDQCAGYCILKHELAMQGSKSAEFPEPVLQKHLKVLDLNLAAILQIPLYSVVSFQLSSHYSQFLIDRKAEIEIPPPRSSMI